MTMIRVRETVEYVGLSTDMKPEPPEHAQRGGKVLAKFTEFDTGRTYYWRIGKGWIEVTPPADVSVLSALQQIARQNEQVQRMLVAAHDLDGIEIIEAG